MSSFYLFFLVVTDMLYTLQTIGIWWCITR